MKETDIMKILKIDNKLGHYSVDGINYNSIDQINKGDLLKLVDVALEYDVDIDEFSEDLIKNQAHQILYKNISEKIKDLYQKKDDFKDESDRLFLKEYERYQNKSQ